MRKLFKITCVIILLLTGATQWKFVTIPITLVILSIISAMEIKELRDETIIKPVRRRRKKKRTTGM